MKVSMMFGAFGGAWRWRVEWTENGKTSFKDFIQSDTKAHESKLAADAFKAELLAQAKAA